MRHKETKVAGFKRNPYRLTGVLETRLTAYAAGAVAAGVGFLSTAQAAEAKVIYTPTRTEISFPSTFDLDLNHDGIPDFTFINSGGSGCCGDVGRSLMLKPANVSNQMWGRIGWFSAIAFPSVLGPGFTIRENKSHFPQGNGLMFHFGEGSSTSHTSGQWLYAKDRYLGLKFALNGETHYGWARVSVTFEKPKARGEWGVFAVLSGYAYETVANKPIVTGRITGEDVITVNPATLGHLAQGASAISTRRTK